MELAKLQQEKKAFEARLFDVIRGEIAKFRTEGGIHPAEITVGIVPLHVFGPEPDRHELAFVKVEFGL